MKYVEYGVMLGDGTFAPAADLHVAFRWGQSPGRDVYKRGLTCEPMPKSGRALWGFGPWEAIGQAAAA